MKHYEVAIIDFETMNSDTNSPCEVGITLVNGLEIVDTYSSFINPKNNKYSLVNARIHNIQKSTILNAPDFEKAYETFKTYLTRSEIIVAHNAHFDMSVLATTLKDYNLELPKFKYIDSVLIFRKFLRNKSVSMENLCNYYNLPKENLHSAKKDTETLAILLKNLAIENEYKSISDLIFLKNQSYIRFSEELRPTTSFMNSKNSFQKAARLSEINNVNVINANNEKLSGKNIVFTGNFNEGKEFLQIMARENNANVRGTVNKNTNYLVEGKQELRFTDENGFVSKQRTARKLIQDGINIILLNEEQFLEMIGESYND